MVAIDRYTVGYVQNSKREAVYTAVVYQVYGNMFEIHKRTGLMRPEAMIGQPVTVYFDPVKPERAYVKRLI